nr:TIGR02186 family protein [Jannaschia sp. S6380]
MLTLLAAVLIGTAPARAEDIVADLSQDRVAISTNFDGSEILIFGAIRREAPRRFDSKMAIIVTVAGPPESVVVRRKERRLGIWVNTASVEMAGVPSFYSIASSIPLAEALTPEADARWHITTASALRGPSMATTPGGDPDFLEALIRVNRASGAYGRVEGAVALRDGTLFSTEIALPADLTEGNYDARIFLTRDGEVVDSYATSLYVSKVGLERWIYALAHDQPLIYGLLSLFIAIVAGWLASAIFRFVRV